jgi:competence protein ComEC
VSLNFFFYRVGNGHCTYVEFPNGNRGLIDLKRGDKPDDDPIHRVRNAEVSRIDHLFITHPHRDHIGGLAVLIDYFRIGNFNHSGVYFRPDPVYDDWIVYEQMKAGKHVDSPFLVRQGLYEDIGDVRITYVAPPKELLRGIEDEVNNNSLMLRFTYGSSRILICGDSGEDAWKRIPDNSIEDLTLLLASHHGNDSGYYAPKMKVMNPKYTVISAGPTTPYDADAKYSYYTRYKVYTTRTKKVVAKCNIDGTVEIS